MAEVDGGGQDGRKRLKMRLLAFAGFVLVLGGTAQEVSWHLADPLPGACWIGLTPAARAGKPEEVAFVRSFELPAAVPSLTLEIESDRGFQLLLDGRPLATGSPGKVSRRVLPGPFARGPHQLTVFVTHPEGVASVRLRLSPRGQEKAGVVTDSSWRADDARWIRDRGPKEARYTAAVWGRPPLSSWGFSSSSRS